jgi:hypothetical protein
VISDPGSDAPAEQLLNNRLQMGAFSATGKIATQAKQTKIGLCEQVRVNWQTAAFHFFARGSI